MNDEITILSFVRFLSLICKRVEQLSNAPNKIIAALGNDLALSLYAYFVRMFFGKTMLCIQKGIYS